MKNLVQPDLIRLVQRKKELAIKAENRGGVGNVEAHLTPAELKEYQSVKPIFEIGTELNEAAEGMAKIAGAEGLPLDEATKKYFAGIKALQDSEEENKGTVYGDTPDTLNITLICLANDRGAAQSLVQNWQKIFGTTLSVTVKTYPNQLKLNSALEKGKYDIAYTSYRTDDAYAVNFLDTFTGTSSANFIGLNDPAYNALVAKARTASMDGSIAACCKEAERYLIQKGYIIPIRQESSSLVSNKGAKDIFADPAGAVLSAFILEEEK